MRQKSETPMIIFIISDAFNALMFVIKKRVQARTKNFTSSNKIKYPIILKYLIGF